jgi:hypothetical protein
VLSIYPNPAKDYIKISWPGMKEAQIALVDSYGRMVQTAILNQGNALLTLKADLPRGLYFVRVIGNNAAVYSRKVILN